MKGQFDVKGVIGLLIFVLVLIVLFLVLNAFQQQPIVQNNPLANETITKVKGPLETLYEWVSWLVP